MKRCLLAAVWVLALAAVAGGQTTRVAGDAGTVEIRSLLVRGPSAKPNGTVTVVDPVQADLADGTFATPVAGEVWKRVECGADGKFQDEGLSGGWAWATVESDVERVMLLRASGHSMVYVNGEPRAGDVYSAGYLVLPVKLRKGINTFLFQAGRGELRARLEGGNAAVAIIREDATWPDLREFSLATQLGSISVVNLTESARLVRMRTSTDGNINEPTATGTSMSVMIPPLSIRKVPVEVTPNGRPDGGTLRSHVFGEGIAPVDVDVDTHVRAPSEMQKVTFVSGIDGSVQYYALRPASRPATMASDGKPSIVLSLHGAGVEATNQANAYASKLWAHIVCPTNRRPYGFNWEEWGRTDALEVLADAERSLPHDPSRIHLTGHSMGGHGTWHLGVNLPGTFAAVAPSAGWVSFASYAKDRAATRPASRSATLEAFRGASLASDTLGLKENLTNAGVYILHGDADDNVPVTEARSMVAALATFHKDWQLHEQPGANHWWSVGDEPGARCVDWPGMFDLFARRRLPSDAEVRDVKFATAGPQVCSRVNWAEVLQQETSGVLSSVDLHVDPYKRRFSGSTRNVSALALDTSVLVGEGATSVELDGGKVEVSRAGRITLWHGDEGWRIGPGVPSGEKNPARAGPLKAALGNRMIFVYGTAGTPGENRLNYDKARFDAESWYYRANGSVDVVADTDELLAREPDRTVVLYGNADTNAAFKCLPGACPISVRRSGVMLGAAIVTADGTAVFCYPRAGSKIASVVAFAPTTERAARAGMRLPVFVPGIGWPDYAVISADSLRVGEKGILAAGFFDQGWGLAGAP